MVQGEIFSPVCFIVALGHLVRKADTGEGILMLDVFVSKLEYADDAALINKTCAGAPRRVTAIAKKAWELADMEISVPKTECMMLRQFGECKQGPVRGEEYEELKFKHVCEWCGIDYPTKDALCTHDIRNFLIDWAI